MTTSDIQHQELTVAPAPHSPARAWVAERLFRHAVAPLAIQVILPGGERLGCGGPDSPTMRITRSAAFFHRLGADAKIGFGESYMAGDWTSTDLAGLLTPFASHVATLIPAPLQAFRRLVDARRPAAEDNTVAGARDNIHRHYDLSNDLFATFLDPTMSYSCAWFADDDELEAAQLRKIDAILDYARVEAGTRMLEIGTGWGALAIRAAQRGAQVTTLTISTEQADLARTRIAEAGLTDRVTVQLRDYRDAEGTYDAVVSVEMIEAVGERYWPTYFATLDRLLRRGGRAGLQAITMPHNRMLATRDSQTWIFKYIFPGGQIPSVPAIEEQLRRTSLQLTHSRSLGQHYAHTLQEWSRRFTANSARVRTLGFGETFRRMWEFYLAYAEAGFRARYLDVVQFQLHKP